MTREILNTQKESHAINLTHPRSSTHGDFCGRAENFLQCAIYSIPPLSLADTFLHRAERRAGG